MYWRPEVASKEGSLMVTDFDVTYSKRSKKWLLQSHSDVAYPQWDDSLVSLVPVNGPGNYPLLFFFFFFSSLFSLICEV